MSLTLSHLAAGITPSATLAIDARAKALKAQGCHVIGFGAGEPDFPTPETICQAGHDAIDQGKTRYTPASGIPELKQAVADKLKAENGLCYAPSQVIITNGAKQALLGAFLALLNPGDEVLMPAPCWVSYPEMIRMAGGVPVPIETSEASNFLPSVENLRAKVTPRTKALLINSPSNPTGCVYPPALLEALAAFAKEHDLAVISDEIYEKLVYDGAKHVSIASLGDDILGRTIVINGVSKTYAMTGWRIGYAAGSQNIIAAMGAYQSHATSNPNSIAQYAALAAMHSGTATVDAMHAAFDCRRKYMVNRINSIDGLSCVPPKGAFYVMMNAKALMGKSYHGKPIVDDMALSALLLDEAKVAVVPGTPFEAPGYCRLSYAISDEDIAEGLDAIEAFVAEIE